MKRNSNIKNKGDKNVIKRVRTLIKNRNEIKLKDFFSNSERGFQIATLACNNYDEKQFVLDCYNDYFEE